jgi:excisionase family DNA binding protein
MNGHPIQFGARENTASPRQHAPRSVVDIDSNAIRTDEGNARLSLGNPLSTDSQKPLQAAQVTATGEKESDTAAAVRLRPSQNPNQTFEHLIDSSDAAKLLGNIHVKTLQRYARTGRLPGYQIGGHWYFRASELDAWLHLQINSGCQSVR